MLKKIKYLNDLDDLVGKKVLLRTGFDCPLDKSGRVLSDNRLRESLPTIKYLVKNHAKVIIISHNGRPEGKIVPRLSLRFTAERLAKLLKKKVKFIPFVLGKEVVSAINEIKKGEILVLENLRFNFGEENNSLTFAKQLASLADVYVNDAFAVCHRKQASIVGVPRYLPGYAGFLVEKEVNKITELLSPTVQRPVVAIIGGAKISSKLPIIKKLLPKVDYVLLGGGVANTFLWAKDFPVGKSLIEKEMLKEVNKIKKNKKIFLPIDVICALDNKMIKNITVDVSLVRDNFAIYDLGKKTIDFYKKIIKSGKTIFWSGPVGLFEKKEYSSGTKELAHFLTKGRQRVYVGGGDTESAIEQFSQIKKFYYISTGGSAMLEFIAQQKLIGLTPLFYD